MPPNDVTGVKWLKNMVMVYLWPMRGNGASVACPREYVLHNHGMPWLAMAHFHVHGYGLTGPMARRRSLVLHDIIMACHDMPWQPMTFPWHAIARAMECHGNTMDGPSRAMALPWFTMGIQ